MTLGEWPCIGAMRPKEPQDIGIKWSKPGHTSRMRSALLTGVVSRRIQSLSED
jgi:hypothetical protein